MIFNTHSDLVGQHALLGASTYHWLNYDKEKIALMYDRQLAKVKGTELHELAAMMIKNKIKPERSNKTFNRYVRDAIGFKMIPEQVLFYSYNCFGTADAICFNKNVLRIHDLKTGVHPAHFEQLLIYAAYFCLEYNIDPTTIKTYLRIYQNDDFTEINPEGELIKSVMDKTVEADEIIETRKRMMKEV